ncbi:MBL fold metallo-hydrolase [Achromobacter sp. AGC78]|uniref:MBL fold metallo-hydrolase n=1 Tax=Achromobacter spanius TaxID=217203 RepID=A0AA42LTX1_9BURK|nr:MBL fold metallo-hydrolase [Achromobacter spanius]MDH0739414.1 MBL fold metallo-hydrolase [Achromobacter spanius]
MSSFPTFRRLLQSAALTLLISPAYVAHAAGTDLQLTHFNPGNDGIFQVSSVLVSGQREAILIDAQFGKSQAEKVVKMVRDSGKTLTTIYISHGDPDFYFGLDTVVAAFPNARVVATEPTVQHIKETVDGKLAFWGPKLGADAPSRAVIPQVLKGSTLTLEGQALEITGLDGPQPDRSFVWIPSLKAVVGGVVVFGNLHVWMADTQTPQSHKDWLATLARIEALKPVTVIPGHYAPGAPLTLESVRYTQGYIRAFDTQTAKAADSAALIAAMKAQYPQAGAAASLELSAKVAKGEMKW